MASVKCLRCLTCVPPNLMPGAQRMLQMMLDKEDTVKKLHHSHREGSFTMQSRKSFAQASPKPAP